MSLSQIQQHTLASLEANIDRIALLPSVVSKLASLDLDSADSTVRIEKLARSDPSFALRLMRLANDEVVGHREINNIPDALLKIGTRHLAEMIFGLSVIEVFVPHTRTQRNLWIHSIQTSLGAGRLAALRPELGVGVEQAMLAGLLHDIGRFLIFENHPQEMAKIDEAEVGDLRDLLRLEVEMCGFDHAMLGHMVCDKLRLPRTVCDMVRTHHFYFENKARVPAGVKELVRLVQEADCVSFSLLRHQTGGRFTATSRQDVEHALDLIELPDRVISNDRWVEEIQNIHQAARPATDFIDIAYPLF